MNRMALTTATVKLNINIKKDRLLDDMHRTEPGCTPEYRKE